MIAENISGLIQEVGHIAQLVIVTKNRSISEMMEAYNSGHRVFAENKVKNLVENEAAMPKDIEWHLIGHLQTNKVKYITSFVKCIQSVDSLKLLETINHEAEKNNKVIDCLLQIRIAEEDTKYGMTKSTCLNILRRIRKESLNNIKIIGLMGMASNTTDSEKVKMEFTKLKDFYESVKSDNEFTTLSMGMSSDYPIALGCGSNLIRVGSKIFESREEQA